jgi:hypothetical protein
MGKYVGCIVLGLTLLLSVQPVFAQTAAEFNALKKEVKALKAGQAALKKQIQALKKAGARGAKPAFKEAMIDIKGAPVKGKKSAKLVMIEFSDYQ